MMQTEEPADAGAQTSESATPSTDGSAAQPNTDDLTGAILAQAAPEPFFQAAPNVLWTTFGVISLIFLLVIFFIMRMRVRPRAAAAKKSAPTDFFEPAGEEADISFDDAPAGAPTKTTVPPAAESEAEVVIERSGAAEVAAAPFSASLEPAATARRPSAFAGLFAKKKRENEPPARDDEAAAALRARNLPWSDAPDHAQSAPIVDDDEDTGDAEPENARALAESEGARRRAETAADYARRQADEEFRRADENRLLSAERELEFERRKLAAAEEHRREALAERERAIAERAGAYEAQLQDLRRDLADELDARFGALAEKFDARLERISLTAASAGRGADQTAISNLMREFDARMTALAEKVETRLVSSHQGGAMSASEGDDRIAAITEMIAGRIAEQRDAMNTALSEMSQRIDSVAGAPQDVKTFRNEIADLKRALGERSIGPNAPMVQLSDIVRNALPPDAYELRAVLPNNRKADCLIKLPHPPGPVAIDARFPVEAFHNLRTTGTDDAERVENEFRRTALRHIVDVAERMIVPEETAESALMFIPSESMYAELHARFPDIVQDSYRARVWIVSPTTLMATLHTIRAVLRDAHARESADLIHSEAQHVLAEVDALRRRVVALEEDFNKARHDVRDVLSSTDQVYRRAETIHNTRRSMSESALDRGSKRIPNAKLDETRAEIAQSEDDGDLWEDDQDAAPDQPPFPLR